MSLAEITGIPRATVIRKLKILIKGNILQINKKKLKKIKSSLKINSDEDKNERNPSLFSASEISIEIGLLL